MRFVAFFILAVIAVAGVARGGVVHGGVGDVLNPGSCHHGVGTCMAERTCTERGGERINGDCSNAKNTISHETHNGPVACCKMPLRTNTAQTTHTSTEGEAAKADGAAVQGDGEAQTAGEQGAKQHGGEPSATPTSEQAGEQAGEQTNNEQGGEQGAAGTPTTMGPAVILTGDARLQAVRAIVPQDTTLCSRDCSRGSDAYCHNCREQDSTSNGKVKTCSANMALLRRQSVYQNEQALLRAQHPNANVVNVRDHLANDFLALGCTCTSSTDCINCGVQFRWSAQLDRLAVYGLAQAGHIARSWAHDKPSETGHFYLSVGSTYRNLAAQLNIICRGDVNGSGRAGGICGREVACLRVPGSNHAMALAIDVALAWTRRDGRSGDHITRRSGAADDAPLLERTRYSTTRTNKAIRNLYRIMAAAEWWNYKNEAWHFEYTRDAVSASSRQKPASTYWDQPEAEQQQQTQTPTPSE